MKEVSYVMVKPEFANINSVISYVKNVLQDAGLDIVDESVVKYDKERAAKHYHEHVGKGFYPELEAYITSDKAYGMVVEGENAIAKIRKLVGSTKNPDVGTIRYVVPEVLGWPERVTQNVVHASDCVEAANLEISIFKDLKAEFVKEEMTK